MQSTLDFIKEKIGEFTPEIGIILGSGLGSFADSFDSIKIPYSQIPGFEASTIQGHNNQLVFAEVKTQNEDKHSTKKVVFMQGRYHFYEGHSMQTVVFPVKVLNSLGIKTLIITNAAGAVNKTFKPSDLMLITDHINLLGTNPLIGKNDEAQGTRFPDMSEVYKKELRQIAKESAKKLGIDLKEGVYAACTGPSYETPAEIKMLSIIGADAVGMSTVPEAIVANYCAIKVLGISCITNYAAGITEEKLSHNEVIESASVAKEKFQSLLLDVLGKIN